MRLPHASIVCGRGAEDQQEKCFQIVSPHRQSVWLCDNLRRSRTAQLMSGVATKTNKTLFRLNFTHQSPLSLQVGLKPNKNFDFANPCFQHIQRILRKLRHKRVVNNGANAGNKNSGRF